MLEERCGPLPTPRSPENKAPTLFRERGPSVSVFRDYYSTGQSYGQTGAARPSRYSIVLASTASM
jgi:hypothetical protein